MKKEERGPGNVVEWRLPIAVGERNEEIGRIVREMGGEAMAKALIASF